MPQQIAAPAPPQVAAPAPIPAPATAPLPSVAVTAPPAFGEGEPAPSDEAGAPHADATPRTLALGGFEPKPLAVAPAAPALPRGAAMAMPAPSVPEPTVKDSRAGYLHVPFNNGTLAGELVISKDPAGIGTGLLIDTSPKLAEHLRHHLPASDANWSLRDEQHPGHGREQPSRDDDEQPQERRYPLPDEETQA
ncbi:hypothetical protein HAQ06_11170 [Pseudomonas sp. C2L12B]|uniref:Uncharacterized protein n=2 Tax=Pseudomonas typographi TaxID=2715964 RepID=A0ABR7Z263_9PSED|nr:hypothetical protein [Pseudomonas typographi]MBD1599532.1 hypothetical protein [Pseudomonas typographi]